MNVLFASVFALLMGSPSTSTLTVNITDIDKPGKGEILVLLWDRADGFPRDFKQAKYKGKITEFGESCSYTFENIPEGVYAATVFQDKNKNKEVDTNFLGIPSEPIGAYNLKGLGKPSFKKSTFTLNQSEQTISIKMMND
jgi:uncharacterized protein (DUF2141 family)